MGNAKKLARRLLKQNRGTASITPRSWRVIAREDYQNKVPAGTLCRFAKSDGDWLPKDKDLLIALGVKKARKEKLQQPQDIFDMATSTLRQAFINRKEMPKIDPRIVREFRKLGWLKRSQAGAQ